MILRFIIILRGEAFGQNHIFTEIPRVQGFSFCHEDFSISVCNTCPKKSISYDDRISGRFLGKLRFVNLSSSAINNKVIKYSRSI